MTHRRLAVHYFARTGLLAFFAYYILHLVREGTLVYYIAPRMELYVKLAAIGFYGLAVLQLYVAFLTLWSSRDGEDCACGACTPVSKSGWGSLFLYGLFAIPLLLGLALPDTALNSTLAEKKGMSLSMNPAPQAQSQAQRPAPAPSVPVPSAPAASPAPGSVASPPAAAGDSVDQLFPYDTFSEDLAKLGKKLYQKERITISDKGFMETLTAMDFYMNRFLGKKVEISGFVYREEDMEENQLVVARFAVQCCSADSAPYGLLVEAGSGKELKKDTWIKVTGTLSHTLYRGNDIMKLEASKVEKTPAPASPYTYPDPDFFENSNCNPFLHAYN
ncbi:TIGR03943 family putative permease subunit [Gorillibacterium sp. sgz5001074]|uniref:TIGR03943 family putative permease subunit n=1 Tax=Gorillibacterium sp. sgz5001074 TaxID=3446695 RepID=UPI003F66742B